MNCLRWLFSRTYRGGEELAQFLIHFRWQCQSWKGTEGLRQGDPQWKAFVKSKTASILIWLENLVQRTSVQNFVCPSVFRKVCPKVRPGWTHTMILKHRYLSEIISLGRLLHAECCGKILWNHDLVEQIIGKNRMKFSDYLFKINQIFQHDSGAHSDPNVR